MARRAPTRSAAAAAGAVLVLVALLLAVGVLGEGSLDDSSLRRPGDGSIPAIADASLPAGSPVPVAVRGGADGPDAGGGEAPVRAPGSVRVRVLDAADGSPVPGAQVTLQEELGASFSGRAVDDGTVTFQGVGQGRTIVLACSEDHADGRSSLFVERKVESRVEVRLSPLSTLRGVVRSSLDRSPIEGARVHIWRQGYPGRAGGDPDAVTDASGVFSVRHGRDRDRVKMTVLADGHAPALEEAAPLRPGEAGPRSVSIELDPAGGVRGVVRDPEGRPIRGAVVELRAAGHGAWMGSFVVDSEDARTQGDGAFSFQGLQRGGVYKVMARATGWSSPPNPLEVHLPLDREEVPCELVLLPAGGLRVSWDTPEGAGEAALVEVARTGVADPIDARSGRGEVVFADLPVGPVRVFVRGAGGHGQCDAEVREGEEVRVSVRLQEGAVVEGVVLGPDGEPFGGEFLMASEVSEGDALEQWPDLRRSRVRSRRLHEWNGGGLHAPTEVLEDRSPRSGADGRFRIRGLTPGARYSIGAFRTGGRTVVTAPASGLLLVARPKGVLAGRLVLPPGSAMPESCRLLWSSGDDPPGSTEVDWKAGRFSVDVPAGGVRFTVLAGSCVLPEREVEVPAGRTLDLGELSMRAGPVTSGTVLDGEDWPVSGVTVTVLAGPTGPGPQGVTIDSGRFRLGCLPEGRYCLGVLVPAEGVPSRHDVEVGREGATLTLRLPPMGTLRGTVRTERGVPLVDLLISIHGESRSEFVDVTVPDHLGRFSIRLPAGNYRVEISDGPRVLAEARAVVSGDGVTSLDLRAER
jgi:hypothetical protein